MIGEAEIEEYYQFLEQLEKKQAQYKDHPDTYLGQQIDLLQQLLKIQQKMLGMFL
jgi:hypothetical protein